MRKLTQSARMLYRQRAVFSIRLLFIAVVLAVTTVSAITLVSEQLKSALISSSSRFIGGDRQLISPREIDDGWLAIAESLDVNWSRSLEFSSMLYANDQLQLVSVKAVDDRYPLKGDLLIAGKQGERVVAPSGPDRGELWLQGRLFSLFGVAMGDQADIGELGLRINQELLQEPDASFALAGLAPRVMMHFSDVPETGVVQAGSRLKWQYYFSGADASLDAFEKRLLPLLESSQRWESIDEGRPAIARALDKTESYLLLGGSLAVLLACVAVAMSARQFALSQVETVAVMKALGVQGGDMVRRFVYQLLVLGLTASLVGLVLGSVAGVAMQSLMKSLVPELSELQLVYFNWRYSALGLATALLCLFSFALPQFLQLRQISPMRVLRAGSQSLLGWSWLSAGFAVFGVLVLLYLYSGNIVLIGILLISLLGILAGIALIAWLLYRFLATPLTGHMRPNAALRHAIQSLLRRRWHSLVQLSVFSFSILLFALIFLSRDSLLKDWQTQLPDDTPNHFLINIAPGSLDAMENVLNASDIVSSGLYPMVRGRLSHINDVPVKQAVTKDVGALNRELNLTWADEVPADNRILSGRWWPELTQGNSSSPKGVSIESQLAERLGVVEGDRLRFMIGGSPLDTRVTSVRSVQWDSMRPNFYMMFEPGALDEFPSTYITSFYLSEDKKHVLNQISRQFPSVSILELDQVVEKVRSIIQQVSVMVEVVMVLILSAALLVMAALIGADLSQRLREAALIRTFGTERRFIMRAQFFEFAVLGFFAGLVAAVCADLVMWQLQSKLFDGGFRLHIGIWLWLPVSASIAGGVICYFLVRRVPTTSPMMILRTG